MQTPSVCVVTGASSGLGRAIALQFAQNGWQVVALARLSNGEFRYGQMEIIVTESACVDAS